MLDMLKGRGANGSNGEKVGLGSIRRPVIGLALGGGAARGFAHIGILKTLLANGIVPDVVVGTSIGAVVGGAYAAGQLETLEDWGRSLQGVRNILSYLDIRLNGSGLIGGEKLATRLEHAIGQTLIEDLPLKFASRRNRGPHRPRDLADARPRGRRHARLLCAARHLFTRPGRRPLAGGRRAGEPGAGLGRPRARRRNRHRRKSFQRHLHLFHDGLFARRGARNPQAAPVAQETDGKNGAFRACSRRSKTMKREFFGGNGRPGISSVMVDAFNIMQDRITRARLAGDPPDLLITPRVGQFGWFDFHRADDLHRVRHPRRRARAGLDPGGNPRAGAGARGQRAESDARWRPIRPS